MCWKLLQQTHAPTSQETACSGRGFSRPQGHPYLPCFKSPYKSPKVRGELTLALENSFLGLCHFTAFTLWAICSAVMNPKAGCPSHQHLMPPTWRWNWLSGTTRGLCLPKCILPSLVSAIDPFHSILMWFDQVKIWNQMHDFFPSSFSWNLCHK